MIIHFVKNVAVVKHLVRGIKEVVISMDVLPMVTVTVTMIYSIIVVERMMMHYVIEEIIGYKNMTTMVTNVD